MTADPIAIREKFTRFDDFGNPGIIAELNGQVIKAVKFQGEFVRHHHHDEDELFMVVQGRFRMDFRDKRVRVETGEMLVVPRGV